MNEQDDLISRRKLVAGFLRSCVGYANAEIARKAELVEAGEPLGTVPPLAWSHYRELVGRTAEEVASGLLDDWLEPSDEPDARGADRHATDRAAEAGPKISIRPPIVPWARTDLERLELETLGAWLATLLAPRPVLLLSTRSAAGVANLSPASSVAVVSNRPPLVTISLGSHTDGRPHDALAHMEAGSSVLLMPLPADPACAALVDLCASPLEPASSEWDLLAQEPVELGEGIPPVHPWAVAAIEARLVEVRELPNGAASHLVILELDSIHRPLRRPRPGAPVTAEGVELPPEGASLLDLPLGFGAPQLLAQVGTDRLVAGPVEHDWSRRVNRHRV